MKPRHVIALLLISTLGLEAATIERIEVPSASMETAIPVAVVLPDSYAQDADRRYNVIYLLHGAGDNYHQWIQPGSPLHRLADEYEFIAVCPSTGTNWYFDSPINPQIRMETFVSTELVDYIDRNYRTNATRETRGICGLSMGGHGALYIGIRHKDTFGAVGNIFGGVDLRPFPENWNIKNVIGDQREHPERWETYSVYHQAKNLKDGELALITMIGTSDFFLEVNRALHQQLNEQGVEHHYIETSGAHDLPFAQKALPVMVRFINHYFNTGTGQLD